MGQHIGGWAAEGSGYRYDPPEQRLQRLAAGRCPDDDESFASYDDQGYGWCGTCHQGYMLDVFAGMPTIVVRLQPPT